jgi:glycosyltransferase involved in cell wall biosynthesis/2-polyprenyl-3-methyl-5-hydroxy-6-metoxy-1,4-benzoquinol methylase
MIILMHCGGMPFNGETIKNESLGGSETAAYYIARELAKRGHRVSMFTNIPPGEPYEGIFDGVKYISAGQADAQNPLGARFHFYATHTPADVCMIQRAPGAFTYRWASKINVCWLHDLALHRSKPMLAGAMWNIDSIFTVSEWHKKQVCDVYGLNPDVVRPVTNGVDLNLFAGSVRNQLAEVVSAQKFVTPFKDQIRLLYSSRPERGLEHHVRPGGIMERLWEIDKRFHLYVCAYDNKVPQMAPLYDALYERIEILPNCTNLGALTKQELADTMRQCDALVYPTEFEEVSCITAMEAMAAGLPFISSEHAALPETCKDSGSLLIPLKDGKADEDCSRVRSWLTNSDIWTARADQQREAAKRYDWSVSAEKFEKHFQELLAARQKNPETVLQSLIQVSDYYAANLYHQKHVAEISLHSPALRELNECYAFARDRTWKEHYENYYEYEKNRGVNYGPEVLAGNTRFESVSALLADLSPGSVVLDYGCAHGHYTVTLAKRFPKLKFVGIDIARSNIDKARAWAADEKLDNIEFSCGHCETDISAAGGSLRIQRTTGEESADFTYSLGSFDTIIAAEVLEHVEAPWDLVDALAQYLKPRGQMIITTPFGPWEAIGYQEHWPWRAHVHHFEREDLYDVFGHHPGFTINVVPGGADRQGDVIGSYLCKFGKPKKPSARVDYERKFRLLAPCQSLSVCLIAKDAELTLGKCLESVKEIADEIIVAVDNTTKDGTREIAKRYAKGFSPADELVFDIPSPMEIGFDEARNLSIAKAKGDWIMWIDADEVLFHPERLKKYLKTNQFNAYALKQIHYTVEPPGILRVDLPARVFRNHAGVKFFGSVHEHPETEVNKGVGHAMQIGDVSIAHYGYSTEEVRRKRFERNIGLLVRDREKFPTRNLGKFLWLRDLAQMCRWEAEKNGGQVTPAMRSPRRGRHSHLGRITRRRPNPDALRFRQPRLLFDLCAGLGRGLRLRVPFRHQQIKRRDSSRSSAALQSTVSFERTRREAVPQIANGQDGPL